jgi:hypothetical protein
VIIGGINNSSTNSASVIVGGCCNVTNGSAFTFVAGGSGNHNKGNVNVVLLGSNLSASQANFTYVNNLSSQGAVYGTFYGDGSNLTNPNPTVTLNNQSGLTYTIASTDNGSTIASTNALGLTAIISNATTYPTGFNIGVLQLTTGRITLSAQNGFTTINQSNGFYKTTKQYSAATLLYTGVTTGWVLFGDLAS